MAGLGEFREQATVQVVPLATTPLRQPKWLRRHAASAALQATSSALRSGFTAALDSKNLALCFGNWKNVLGVLLFVYEVSLLGFCTVGVSIGGFGNDTGWRSSALRPRVP